MYDIRISIVLHNICYNMIINIRNWGAVGAATIDTDKPLIIMCGPNSTGKTYVSYLLYALFSKSAKDFVDGVVPDGIIQQIKETNKFNLEESYLKSVLDQTASYIKRDLIPTVFAISEDVKKILFRYFRLNLDFSEGQYERIISTSHDQGWYIPMERISVKLKKDANSSEVNVYITKKEEDNTEADISLEKIPFFEELLFSFLRSITYEGVRDARMLTVERNSIYTFNKELSLTRNAFRDEIPFNVKNPGEIMSLLEINTQRYPLAITDSLRIANDLQLIQKNKGEYYEYASKLEENLLRGSIEVNKSGAVEFEPFTHAKTKPHLPIQMTSSIVKTMSSLILYLKHLARKNDLVIIDEPEMNLHPDNQILLTRIFAELVNKGLRIVISTHSDYIIREFNNMIMAKEISAKKNLVAEGIENPYPKSQMLSIKDTEVLYFNISRTTNKIIGSNIPVSEYGFDIASIDATIQAQNSNTHFLSLIHI